MSERELTLLLQMAGGFLVILGALAGFIWTCLHYIFTRHRDDNDCEHKVMSDAIKVITDEMESLKIELTVLKTQRDQIMCERMKQHIKG